MLGSDSPCGCPICCPFGTITCSLNKHFFPNELEGKIFPEELKELADKVKFLFSNFFI
jgi:hypothetical protein